MRTHGLKARAVHEALDIFLTRLLRERRITPTRDERGRTFRGPEWMRTTRGRKYVHKP